MGEDTMGGTAWEGFAERLVNVGDLRISCRLGGGGAPGEGASCA